MTARAARLGAIAFVLFASAPAHAFAQNLARADSPGIPWFRIVAALLFCLALAVGAAYVLRLRMGANAPLISHPSARRIALIETLRLSHQIDVCLLHWDDEQILVAASVQGVSILARRPKTDVSAP